MTPLAIAIIAYVGGALTMYTAQRISEAARRYPDPRIHGATINGDPACPGCGVPMPHHSVCHYQGCSIYGGPWVRIDEWARAGPEHDSRVN